MSLSTYGLLLAMAHGADNRGWVIIVLGLLFAGLWIGCLRVGSQISLFPAPFATFLLLLGWLAVPLGFSERRWARELPAETLQRRGILPSETTVTPAPATP